MPNFSQFQRCLERCEHQTWKKFKSFRGQVLSTIRISPLKKSSNFRTKTRIIVEIIILSNSTPNLQTRPNFSWSKQELTFFPPVTRTTTRLITMRSKPNCFLIDVVVMLFYCCLVFCYNIGKKNKTVVLDSLRQVFKID